MSQTTADPMVGRRLLGRYEVVERIGAGRTGPVYRALQAPLKRPVAIKLLSADLQQEPRQVRRFVDEARILSRLHSPHTVRLLDVGRTESGRFLMVTEYVGGGTLGALMEGRRVAPEVALRLAQQVARALAEAHALGIVHRDLKPENILIEQVQGGDLVARLIDFGLAREEPDDGEERREVTRPRTRLGTPGYMSPEQAFRLPCGPASDLYALGSMLFEMLTGHPVFEADSREALHLEHRYSTPPTLRAVAPDLDASADLEALVRELLAKEPSARPTAESVVARLDAMLRRMAPSAEWTAPAQPRLRPEPMPMEPRRFVPAYFSYLAGAALGGALVGVVALIAAV